MLHSRIKNLYLSEEKKNSFDTHIFDYFIYLSLRSVFFVYLSRGCRCARVYQLIINKYSIHTFCSPLCNKIEQTEKAPQIKKKYLVYEL